MRALVVGARRSRQGIGPFVARTLMDEGVELCAVVGSSGPTAQLARADLFPGGNPACGAYGDLETALVEERPDVVCICSPYAVHREHLEIVARHSCHCLCEKPLWWGDVDDRVAETARLVDLFLAGQQYLALLTQWPCTLSDYFSLHKSVKGRPVRDFEMHLGPISTGAQMVLDAAPHPLSMLQHLVGYGSVVAPSAEYLDAERRDLCISFEYAHATGVTKARFRFTTTEHPPRPASYAINGAGVRRSLELPRYDIFLSAGDRRIRIEDPLRSLVRKFLGEVATGARVRRQELIESISALQDLHVAALSAE